MEIGNIMVLNRATLLIYPRTMLNPEAIKVISVYACSCSHLDLVDEQLEPIMFAETACARMSRMRVFCIAQSFCLVLAST